MPLPWTEDPLAFVIPGVSVHPPDGVVADRIGQKVSAINLARRRSPGMRDSGCDVTGFRRVVRGWNCHDKYLPINQCHCSYRFSF